MNQKQLFAYELAYPAFNDQHRIVAYLDDLQAKMNTEKHLRAETQAELQALLPSVLDRAFRGGVVMGFG